MTPVTLPIHDPLDPPTTIHVDRSIRGYGCTLWHHGVFLDDSTADNIVAPTDQKVGVRLRPGAPAGETWPGLTTAGVGRSLVRSRRDPSSVEVGPPIGGTSSALGSSRAGPTPSPRDYGGVCWSGDSIRNHRNPYPSILSSSDSPSISVSAPRSSSRSSSLAPSTTSPSRTRTTHG